MFQRVQITVFTWEEKSIRISPCTRDISCVFFTLHIIQSYFLIKYSNFQCFVFSYTLKHTAKHDENNPAINKILSLLRLQNGFQCLAPNRITS